MATKKPVKTPPKATNGCLPATIILIMLVALSVTAAFYFLFLRPGPALAPPTAGNNRGKVTSSPEKTAATPTAATMRPAPAESPAPKNVQQAPSSAATVAAQPTEETPRPINTDPPSPTAANGRPRVAIIIDDIGDTKAVAEQIIGLDLPLAFSIMPHTPHGAHLAGLAHARGRDLLIHVPMEASDAKRSSGPGMLLLSMNEETLINTTRHDLDTPYRAIGVNNHMGSKFSQDPRAMGIFLKEIKAKNLFFIDSLTARDSTGYAVARDLGIKTGKRDIFLDNDKNPTQILAQIGRLINLAERHGSAIGIGHPHPGTLEALRSASTRLKQEVVMVPVHELAH